MGSVQHPTGTNPNLLFSTFIQLHKDRIGSPVVLGEKHDNLLLGATTLEGLGLALDPFQRKLYQAHFNL